MMANPGNIILGEMIQLFLGDTFKYKQEMLIHIYLDTIYLDSLSYYKTLLGHFIFQNHLTGFIGLLF